MKAIRSLISCMCEYIPFGVAFRAQYRSWVRAREIMMRRHQLQKHGPEIVGMVHRVASDLKVPYFLDYGSLLGCIREHGFIKHDDDLDFSVMPDFVDKVHFAEVLMANGFVFRKGFECEGRLTEYAFYYKGVSVDFFFPASYGDRIGTEIYVTGGVVPGVDDRIRTKSAVRAYRERPETLHEIAFVGQRVSIPANSERLLECSYGMGWRNPVSGWSPEANDPNREVLVCESYVIGRNRVLSGMLK